MEFAVHAALFIGLLSVAFFLLVRVRCGGASAVMAKIVPGIFFILTAMLAVLAGKETVPVEMSVLMIAGLMLGLIGDIVLDLKVAYSESADLYLYCGMASFALGHVAYIAAVCLMLRGAATGFEGRFLWIAAAAAAVFSLAAVFGGRKLGLHYGKFTLPSLVYAFLLSFMMCTTGIGVFSTDGQAKNLVVMFIGAILFVISDLILSRQYFYTVDHEVAKGVYERVFPCAQKKSLVIANHVTYYLAQFLMAMSIFGMR